MEYFVTGHGYPRLCAAPLKVMVREKQDGLTDFMASLVELPLLLGDDLLEQSPDLAVVPDGEGSLELLPPLVDFLIGRGGRFRRSVADQLHFGAVGFLQGGSSIAR